MTFYGTSEISLTGQMINDGKTTEIHIETILKVVRYIETSL